MRTKPGLGIRLLLLGVATGVAGCGVPQQRQFLAVEHAAAEISSAPQPEPTTTPSPVPAPVPKPKPKLVDPAAITAAARSIEPRTTVAAEVFDLTTGAELLAIEPDRQFRSASLVKLMIAIDTLNRGADNKTRERIATMLRLSDDDIASWLWVRGDGPAIIRRSTENLGLVGTRPPKDAGQWGDVLLTAHDVARVYRHLLTAMPEADRALILRALADAPEVAADGFDQYFGIPSALKAPWAIKQGWSDSRTDIVVHTSGLVGENWRYIVIVLTEHPRTVSWKTATKSVTAATQALLPLL